MFTEYASSKFGGCDVTTYCCVFVCIYLYLSAEKYDRKGSVMVVECRANQFTVPEMTLAEFIEHKR